MAITLVDEMHAHPWERYSAFLGRFLPFLVFGISILGFILHKSIGTQLAMFFISFFIALLEAPWVYALFPPCYRVRDKLIEDLGFSKGWVRGVTYAAFSIIAYLPRPTIAILSGLLLDLAAVLYTCSSLFADETIGEENKFEQAMPQPSSTYQPPPPPPPSASFGTF
ncbi:Hypothetical protein NocV09_02600970 [Nannochloropsis oceanica]